MIETEILQYFQALFLGKYSGKILGITTTRNRTCIKDRMEGKNPTELNDSHCLGVNSCLFRLRKCDFRKNEPLYVEVYRRYAEG